VVVIADCPYAGEAQERAGAASQRSEEVLELWRNGETREGRPAGDKVSSGLRLASGPLGARDLRVRM
jgi:hypothetical protein